MKGSRYLQSNKDTFSLILFIRSVNLIIAIYDTNLSLIVYLEAGVDLIIILKEKEVSTCPFNELVCSNLY